METLTVQELDETLARPRHLIELPGSAWSMWRWIALRGAGFPIAGVFSLAAPDCAAAAHRVVAAEDNAEQAWQTALAALRSEMNDAEGERRGQLSKSMKHLKKGKLRMQADVSNATASALNHFETGCAHVDSAWDNYRKQFEITSNHASQVIQHIARDPRFREALTWQNREAVHTGVDALVSESPEQQIKRDKLVRKREMLVANYWQRYCTKNDTIGFFGPVGWAKFVSHGAPLTVQAGPTLLADRHVYYEGWGIDELVKALGNERALLRWVPPRQIPSIHSEANRVYLPLRKPVELSEREAAVLHACDGEQTAQRIASELLATPSTVFASEEEVYRVLEHLQQTGIISWTVEVPWTTRIPKEWNVESNLYRLLGNIGDKDLHITVAKIIAELETKRASVAQAAGDAAKLDHALRELEETFTRLTDSSPTRAAGKMYGGRTLVYEDCRRNIEMEVGPEILDSLAPPLSLLLVSARWFTFNVATEYRRAFKRIYDRLMVQTGSPVIDFTHFSTEALPLIYGDEKNLTDDVLVRLQERWAGIISVSPEQRRVARSCQELQPKVKAVFDAPHSGWQYARYHSPDVMIAAASVEAIRHGEYDLVMGEFHVGTNTLANTLFVAQHSDPEDVFRALDRDLPLARLVPVPPKYRLTSRDYTLFTTSKDYRLEFVNEPSGVPLSQALRIGTLVVEQVENKLILRTRDGCLRFDLIEAFADALSDKVSNSFKIFPPRRHSPRISFDRLIVARESWSFSPAEMEFAYDKDESSRYLEARRWTISHDLPRFLFVKSQVESKPIFIDLTSPTYINLLAKLVRQSAEACLAAGRSTDELLVTLTEMLPLPDEVWLPDAVGQRYTSELRMVAVDPNVALE